MSYPRGSTVFLMFFLALCLCSCPGRAADLDSAKAAGDKAIRLFQEGRYVEAIPPAREALAGFESALGPDHPIVSASVTILARMYDAAGRYDQAEPLYKRALALDEKIHGRDSPEAATSLNNLGVLYYQQGRYDQAAPLQRRALAIREKVFGPDHIQTAMSVNNLASLYDALGDYDRAEPLYQRSLAIREKVLGPDDPKVAVSLNNLAALYDTRGRYDRAEPLYRRALAIREKAFGPDHPAVADNLNNLAFLHDARGEYCLAEPLYERALSIREKALGPDHPLVALSLNNLAELYKALGEYARAEAFHLRALSVREKALGPDHPEVAQSLNNLALVLDARGDVTRAETMYQRALKVWEKAYGPDHPETSAALNNLAEFYKGLGDYEKAEPLYRRALSIREKAFGPDHPSVAMLLNNLAGLHEAREEFEEAEPLLKRALSIWEKVFGPDHPAVATALNNLAALYFSQGLWDKAEPLDRRALAIRKKVFGPDHWEVAQSLNNLAGYYYMAGDTAKAESMYQEVVTLMEKALGTDHPSVAAVLGNQAVLSASRDRWGEAHRLLKRVQDIDRGIVEQVMGFTSEDQKMAFLQTKRRELYAYFSVVRQLTGDPLVGRQALDVWLKRKGVVLEAQRRFQEAIVYGDEPGARRVFQELARTRAELSKLVFTGPGRSGREEYRRRTAELQARIKDLEAELSRLSQAYARKKKMDRADSAGVAATLPPGSVLLEFARYEVFDFKTRQRGEKWKPARYMAFVLAAGAGDVAVVDLGDAETIDRAVAELKKRVTDLEDLEGIGAGRAASRLYELVFGPLREKIGRAGEVFVSPDGNLNLVPFEVLRGPDGRYLIEDFIFNYLSSGRDVLGFGRGGDAGGRALLLGDPDFDLKTEKKPADDTEPTGPERRAAAGLPGELRSLVFSPLSGTRKEVMAIRDILGKDRVELHLGGEVREDVLRFETSPRIIHLATHGFFLPDPTPSADEGGRSSLIGAGSRKRDAKVAKGFKSANPLLRSGLALAGANQSLTDPSGATDGILTAEKVLGLRLQGTDLVVLSACETGLGEVHNGEGVYGLRRAFAQAGAKGMVLSMWSVPDLETQELMTRFYRNMKAGQPRHIALRRAALNQLKMVKARYGHTNPLFWGAFVFLGRP